jgi:hypothetical protein
MVVRKFDIAIGNIFESSSKMVEDASLKVLRDVHCESMAASSGCSASLQLSSPR